ncbi:NaeI family type II restriction endonuclease [Deinococcus maricopensis]|uniref:NaeI family type II restriction endonuclease n=1 Tax=Deinococcus maricopensis TaxID=309887 RepID=UPI00145C58D3|nr:NaeI family type II restriction endonuclease [Deinococcus maricopensis]
MTLTEPPEPAAGPVLGPAGPTAEELAAAEAELLSVRDEILRLIASKKLTPEQFFASVISQSVDEVIDSPRTGRFLFSDLEKTEKTYVGTKVEIIGRNNLDLKREGSLDTIIAGVPVDVKWSADSKWMIPLEYMKKAIKPVCLMIGTRKQGGLTFDVFIGRPEGATGKNRDGKSGLSRGKLKKQAAGTYMPLVENGRLDPEYLSTLSVDARARVMAKRPGQAMVNQLMLESMYRQVPRSAIMAAAQQLDGARRVRQDASRRTPLPYYTLMGKWDSHRDAAAHLGYALDNGMFMPVQHADIAGLPVSLRNAVLNRRD